MHLPILVRIAETLSASQLMLSAGQVDLARIQVDKLRQLRSTIKRSSRRMEALTGEEWEAHLTGTEVAPVELLPVIEKISQSTNEMSVWLTSVIENVGREELLRSQDGINLLLDQAIPPVWDFNHDIAVLHGENSERFADALVERGQMQIVIVSEFLAKSGEDITSTPQVVGNKMAGSSTARVLRVRDSSDLSKEQLALLTKSIAPELIVISTDLEVCTLESASALERNVWKEYIYANTARLWPATFCHQLIDNLPIIYRCKNVLDLRPSLEKKDILIVSPGPSLLESLPQLVLLHKHFILVSLIRSLPVLLDAGIIPDFAIMIDASDHTEPHLNLIPDSPLLAEIPLLVTDYTHRSTLNSSFSECILMPSAELWGSYLYNVLYGESPLTFNGGSVATFAVALFAELGAKSITLVGQDLSISGRSYASLDQPNIYPDEHGDLTCLGINGDQLTTQADFMNFIQEFTALSLMYSHKVRLINATAYGAFLEGWEHIPLNVSLPSVEGASARPTENYPSCLENERSVAETKTALIDALTSEIKLLCEVEALARNITAELEQLIRTEAVDVSALEVLEEQLQTVIKTKGPIIRFYTTPAKLDTDVELLSVNSLQENYVVSLGYYKSIEVGAKRLVSRMTSAMTDLDLMS